MVPVHIILISLVPDTGIAGNVPCIKAYAGILAVKTKNWRKLQLVPIHKQVFFWKNVQPGS